MVSHLRLGMSFYHLHFNFLEFCQLFFFLLSCLIYFQYFRLSSIINWPIFIFIKLHNALSGFLLILDNKVSYLLFFLNKVDFVFQNFWLVYISQLNRIRVIFSPALLKLFFGSFNFILSFFSELFIFCFDFLNNALSLIFINFKLW